MDSDSLKNTKNIIEKMEKTHQLEILKILKDNKNVVLNENKSGVYINLTYCPEETIERINKYIEHTKIQEDTLIAIENKKNIVKSEYFTSNI